MEKFGKYEVKFDEEDGCWYQIGVAWDDLLEGDLVLIDWVNTEWWERATKGKRCIGEFFPTNENATFYFKIIPDSDFEDGFDTNKIPPKQDYWSQKFSRRIFFGFLRELELENYRGFFSKQLVQFAENGNITFLVGPNNSGKSLIARSFEFLEGEIQEKKSHNFSINDFPNINTLRDIIFTLTPNPHCIPVIELKRKVTYLPLTTNLKLFFYYMKKEMGTISTRLKIGNGSDSDQFSAAISRHYSKSVEAPEMEEISSATWGMIEFFAKKTTKIIKDSILVLSPIRSLDQKALYSLQETGQKIGKWLNSVDDQDIINEVKRKVFGLLSELSISPPTDFDYDEKENQLFFKYDIEKYFLKELGTGVSMIMILFLEIFRNPNLKFVIIDEIESHIQPGLVRELIKILRKLSFRGERKRFQLVIATHSPTVLDSSEPGDEIYRFEKVGKECRIHPFFNGRSDLASMRKAANSLGGLPGDALLSNVVIWVEGPTDVKWIRALLSAFFDLKREKNKKFPYLIDGLQYSIIMTGGALIAHYQFYEENGLESGISVTRVNPNPFVIIDGDGLAGKTEDEKFKRANRFAEELRKQNEAYESKKVKKFLEEGSEEPDDRLTHGTVKNFWWLKGKEIENYCPPALMKEFLESMVGRLEDKWQIEVFSTNAGEGFDWIKGNAKKNLAGKEIKDFKKIDLANFVSERLTMDHFEMDGFQDSPAGKDLMDGLERLVGFVLAVNEMEG